jgi:uncharacterized protein YdaU (DUF1376 family)
MACTSTSFWCGKRSTDGTPKKPTGFSTGKRNGVNFYKRYPADYGKKTARLTLAQHGAYTLLLDEIYSSESGLPADYEELHRICRAMNKGEQEAVRVVADKFFPIGEDGLRHNNRATEELIEAAPAIEAARANGKKGGRPRKETQQKPTGFSKDNPDETQNEPRTKAPHSSESSSLRSEDSTRKRGTPEIARPDDVAEQTWGDWLQLRKGKRAAVTATVLSEARVEAGKAGLTLDRFLAVWCVRGSQGLQADWLKPSERGAPQPGGETAYQRNMRERMEGFAPGIAARPPGQSRPLTVIEEVQDVPAIASR